jgi:hypothetical protein
VPLGIAVYSINSSSPVLELKATNISYGPVSANAFKVSPPRGAKVVQISSSALNGGSTGQAANAHAKAASAHGKGKHNKQHPTKANTEITGAAAVQAHLPFTLAAPGSLDGLPQQSVQLLDWGGSPAALVTYGQGLGGIAVIEQGASGQSSSGSQSADHQGLTLPTVSINGHSAQELPTALGTVLRLQSGGVEYTVLGSVPPTAAELAAQALVP